MPGMYSIWRYCIESHQYPLKPVRSSSLRVYRRCLVEAAKYEAIRCMPILFADITRASVVETTSSGVIVFNDAFMQLTVAEIPLAGVGESGCELLSPIKTAVLIILQTVIILPNSLSKRSRNFVVRSTCQRSRPLISIPSLRLLTCFVQSGSFPANSIPAIHRGVFQSDHH